MPKDYAKYPYKPERTGIAGWGSRFFLALIFILLLSIGLYGLYVYKSPSHPIKTFLTELKLSLPQKKSHSPPSTRLKLAEENPVPEVHFDFYTTLPNMQMHVKERTSPEIRKVDENITHYALQLAIYKNETAAKAHRISLILQGYDVNLVKTKKGFYRLQKGTYPNLKFAQGAQAALKKKGIESIIIRQEKS